MQRTVFAIPLWLLVSLTSGCASEELRAKSPAAPVTVDLSAKAEPEATAEPSPEEARAEAVAQAGQILGALQGSAFDDASKPIEPESMMGDTIGNTTGTGGLGLVGTGQGGGGTGEGTIGLGNIGTLGHGAGTGTGAGYGSGSGGFGGARKGPTPTLRYGAMTGSSGLPKEVIQRVVRRHSAQLRYCYERSLVQDPTLSGNLTAKFTINGAGAVIAAKADGDLKNKEVASCVERTFMRMVFPEPQKGVTVQVAYPVTFKPAVAPAPAVAP